MDVRRFAGLSFFNGQGKKVCFNDSVHNVLDQSMQLSGVEVVQLLDLSLLRHPRHRASVGFCHPPEGPIATPSSEVETGQCSGNATYRVI
jgi:hypothetical protein